MVIASLWVIVTWPLQFVPGQPPAQPEAEPFVVVLGIAQDAGYPQAGCRKACCAPAWQDPSRRRGATCIAVVDPQSRQRWLVECTPDFREQLHALDQVQPADEVPGLDGILLTHAHIGHYTGLVHLGREVMGARDVPVFAMPRMRDFLSHNGPWDQLLKLNNVRLVPLADEVPVALNSRIEVTPVLVPHRDEYSETVALLIRGPSRQVLFLPDIDQWSRWEKRIEEQLEGVDAALLDATFYDGRELPGRDLSQIPHPLVAGSIQRFGTLSATQRDKIHFIHLNHTNPLLDDSSPAAAAVRRAGMHVARQGQRLPL